MQTQYPYDVFCLPNMFDQNNILHSTTCGLFCKCGTLVLLVVARAWVLLGHTVSGTLQGVCHVCVDVSFPFGQKLTRVTTMFQ